RFIAGLQWIEPAPTTPRPGPSPCRAVSRTTRQDWEVPRVLSQAPPSCLQGPYPALPALPHQLLPPTTSCRPSYVAIVLRSRPPSPSGVPGRRNWLPRSPREYRWECPLSATGV